VWLAGCTDTDVAALSGRYAVDGVVVRAVPAAGIPDDGSPLLEQRADTLIDPRLVALIASRPVATECVDDWIEAHPREAKSPYKVGTPAPGDVRDSEPGEPEHPIGLRLRRADGPIARVRAGRYYWHRIWSNDDRVEARRKVFLATMKPTDGMYARTNRRVSIPISTCLAAFTPVTANMATIFTLGVSVLSGWLFSRGGYAWMLLASVVSWIASMLDGVDGELARAKFQASRLGAWLEMTCDYAYYMIIFVGMSVGVARQFNDPFWLRLGAGALAGMILTFVLVARWNRRYYRETRGHQPGYGFQQTVGSAMSNPVFAFVRRVNVLATRAAMPYYIMLFALVGGIPVILAFGCVGANIAWMAMLYADRLPVVATTAPRSR
jgi:phosphatidylglycerophosphate synthase